MLTRLTLTAIFLFFATTCSIADRKEGNWRVGIAKAIITPQEPIWMSGYGSRNRPADGKISDLWAKVITIEDPQQEKIVLITLDLVGVDADITEQIRRGIFENAGVAENNIAITTTHTHSGPVVGTNLNAMYQLDYEAWRQINRYTRQVIKQVLQLNDAAQADLRPAEINWTVGRASFAVNRRNNPEKQVPLLAQQDRLAGPVDHDVPMLVVRSLDVRSPENDAAQSPSPTEAIQSDETTEQSQTNRQEIRAIICGYACHATVLSGYQWCADWPGFAQTEIEKRYPGSTAMMWIGCGADQNPIPRRSVELAKQYGEQIRDAVTNAMDQPMHPIAGSIKTRGNLIDLDFSSIQTRQELEESLHSTNRFEASRARHLLQQWDQDGEIPSKYPYPIQSWKLGNGPLWFFLGGEVVIDYALRLKQELGAGATWVTAYANDVMAYIPSERVLSEGGYEGGGSMVYYGLPSPWKEGLEESIIGEARSQAEALTGVKANASRSLHMPLYPDHSNLSVWLDGEGKIQPIMNKDDWLQRREHILDSMQMVMGRIPDKDELLPLHVKILESEAFDGYERQRISYTVDQDGDATAHLYIPTKAKKNGGIKRPAVLALHPTSMLGKRIVAGEGPRPNRNYGQELALRGYVVLAPDYPSFGDQKGYSFHTDSYLSGTMKAIVNHRRGVDLLSQMPEVDEERIGAIGHSLGGHNAIFVGAFDERIQCVVSSCGWDPFPYYYGGRLAGWSSDRYMPRIRECFGLDPKQMPFDLPEVIAAIAPRAFFSCSPLNDSNFDAEGVKKAEPQIRGVYERLKVQDRFVIEYPDADHDFPEATRQQAYRFLDHSLIP